MQRSRFDGRVASIKAKFKELDESKDGALQFEEVKDLLRAKRPDAKDRDLKWWFQEYDKTKRGWMNFKDFSDFCLKEDLIPSLLEEREEDGKRQRVDVDSPEDVPGTAVDVPEDRETSAAESAGLDWQVVQNVFNFYAGSDKVLQGNEFARLCRDCNLFDDEYFTPGHAQLVFSKFTAKDSTVMKKQGFRKSLICLASMKGVPVTYFRTTLAQRTEQIQEGQQAKDQRLQPSFLNRTSATSTLPRRRSLPNLMVASDDSSTASPASSATSAIRSSFQGNIAVALRKATGGSAGRQSMSRNSSTPSLRKSVTMSCTSKSGRKRDTLRSAAGKMLSMKAISESPK